jgi:hypothetical protein
VVSTFVVTGDAAAVRAAREAALRWGAPRRTEALGEADALGDALGVAGLGVTAAATRAADGRVIAAWVDAPPTSDAHAARVVEGFARSAEDALLELRGPFGSAAALLSALALAPPRSGDDRVAVPSAWRATPKTPALLGPSLTPGAASPPRARVLGCEPAALSAWAARRGHALAIVERPGAFAHAVDDCVARHAPTIVAWAEEVLRAGALARRGFVAADALGPLAAEAQRRGPRARAERAAALDALVRLATLDRVVARLGEADA